MDDGWNDSAAAWIAATGDRGDWGRAHVMDPAMLARIEGRGFRDALDVGCGEGRFCRAMQRHGIATVGIDPTEALITEARRRDPTGRYQLGRAEALPFADASFDLTVSYLTLIDIPDYRAAIAEMARVLRPGGALLIANITSFVSPCNGSGWVRDADERPLHFRLDRYLDEFPQWLAWDGIRVQNWHRPLSAYMAALLGCALSLRFFDEPGPIGSEDAERAALYRRVPWFLVMEWEKAASP